MNTIRKITKMLMSAIVLLFAAEALAAQDVVLTNQYISAVFAVDEGSVSLKGVSRLDGSDALAFDSDEFEILLFDKSRFTAHDYKAEGMLREGNSFQVDYRRLPGLAEQAPAKVMVTYTLADGPYLFKDLYLGMEEGQTIDRLQVMRFAADQTASRGGLGQPVFIGDWFFGVNYPCFHSRHSDGFVEPNFRYTYHYTVDLEDGDKEYAPRKGLVTLFHFPGYASEQDNGSWAVKSKRAVIGIAAKKGEGAELGLLDYIEKYRKPSRSYLHFNNWFTDEAKKIDVEHFVNDVAVDIKTNLERYGAHLDAMVPDDGWQKTRGYERVYESRFPLPEVSRALREMDVDMGIWVAINGWKMSIPDGEKVGYRRAIPADSKTLNKEFWNGRFFNILDPKYQEDYKRAARYLLEDCDVRYIKHDFNHMYAHGHLSKRHGREACLDVMLELIAYERKLNPKVLINYTNGTFFTPFWLLEVEYLWMNSADAGRNKGWPQLSKLEVATTYRDNHFYDSFNNPARTVRPIIPIANFMTHGILHSKSKYATYFDPETDPIHEWLNYVVMYYGRGTLLKELYILPEMMTEPMWKALGTASAWATANEDQMRNTVLVGGDANKGQVYGFISWQGDKAMLTVRNPDRRPQTLIVPFDATVYYRGEIGQQYRARAVYPFVEQMPWKLIAGEEFSVEVPGDSVVVFEVTEGEPLVAEAVAPEPLPAVIDAESSSKNFSFTLQIPDEEFPHYELLIYHGKLGKKAPAALEINGSSVTPRRKTSSGTIMTAYDLRPYRGQQITVTGDTPSRKEQVKEAWLVVDRKVPTPVSAVTHDQQLPWAIGQGHRRITQRIFPHK